MTQQPQGSRARPATALAAILTLAILVGSGVVAAATLTGPAEQSNRFLPADGQATAAWWQQGEHRARASVEQARLHGSNVFGAFPTSLINRSAPVAGRAVRDTDWWREVITPSSLTDPTPRLRLRSVSPDGIRLHAQDWGRLGIVFDPAPIELPTAVRVGSRWTDHGVVGLADNAVPDYRRQSRALRPAAPDRAAAGCIQVRSRTTMTPKDRSAGSAGSLTWQEDEVWCPGAGVVESAGSFPSASGSTRYRLSPDAGPPETVDPALVRRAPPSAAGTPTADWTRERMQFDRGDDTFGLAATDVVVDTPLPQRVAADRSGTLHAVAGNTTDVTSGFGLQPGKVWLHSWAHPGGSITAVTSIGMLTLVSTDRRVLRAYDPYGRVRWTVGLHDLTSVPPVAAPGNRILVTTLRGDLIMLDARTGSTVWSQRISGPITIPPVATDRAIAIGTTTGLIVVDPADGRQRWRQDVTDPIAVATVGDVVVVMSYGYLRAYGAADGRYRWEELRDEDLLEMITVDDQLVVTSVSWIESISATGRTTWRHDGTPITTSAVGNTIVTTDRHRISALRSDGSVQAQWPVAATVTADHQLLTADGVVFAVGRTDDYTLAGVRIAPADQERS